jgi:hypothetical protein
MITDFEKFISMNQVVPKSITLWQYVRKQLLKITPNEERNEQLFPDERLVLLNDKLKEVKGKIRVLTDIISSTFRL